MKTKRIVVWALPPPPFCILYFLQYFQLSKMLPAPIYIQLTPLKLVVELSEAVRLKI